MDIKSQKRILINKSLNTIRRTSIQKTDEILHITKDNPVVEKRIEELLGTIESEIKDIKDKLNHL